MFKIVIICEDEELATRTRWDFQAKYSLIPSGCFITGFCIEDILLNIRENTLTVHAIIDVDGDVTARQMQELIDNKMDYYFVPDIKKLNEAKSFGSCDYPL